VSLKDTTVSNFWVNPIGRAQDGEEKEKGRGQVRTHQTYAKSILRTETSSDSSDSPAVHNAIPVGR